MIEINRPWSRWYKTARWRRLREQLLTEQPLCVMCLRSETVTVATVADHIIPHRGNEHLFWEGELQSLCASCHSRHKQLEENGKTVLTFSADGWPA